MSIQHLIVGGSWTDSVSILLYTKNIRAPWEPSLTMASFCLRLSSNI